jgi:hypothetical protein
MKSRRMRWVEHTTHLENRRGANIWWETVVDRDYLENPGPYGRIILKWIFWLIHIFCMTPGQQSRKN